MPSQQLILASNNLANPQTIDLTPYLDVTPEKGMDLANPAFSNRIWSRSLLKEGATLSYEQLTEKELTFPVHLGPAGVAGAPATLSQTLAFIAKINAMLESPGTTLTWQPLTASQPTTFDVLSGLLEIAYNYWEENQAWTSGNLRVFTKPLGRTAGPRRYATASGFGPLLMISPYASSGAQAIGASTQAGVAGFGGLPLGASTGVFYWGSPSLAGDAPAQLQVSYVGPLPNQATNTGVTPTVAVSLLPDAQYTPLITSQQVSFLNLNGVTNRRNLQTSVASSYIQLGTSGQNSVFDTYSFNPLATASDIATEPTLAWAGLQRLFAIARASAGAAGTASAVLAAQTGPLMQNPTTAAVPVGPDWDVYDLGTLSLRPSAYPQSSVQVRAAVQTSAASAALDLAALVMLPDATTWFMNPMAIVPSQYGYPANLATAWGAGAAAWSNTLLLDDVIGDQFLYLGQSQTSAPSPLGSVPSATRITAFSRGLMPQPDPKNGLPIIAILGVGQNVDPQLSFPTLFTPQTSATVFGASATNDAAVGTVPWTNPANAEAFDGVSAGVTLTPGQTSEYIKVMGYGFSIPTSATITNVVVTEYTSDNFSPGSFGSISMTPKGVKAGVVQAADVILGSWWSTYTPADINNPGFGIAIVAAYQAGGSGSASFVVDAVAIAVSYTFGSGPSVFNGGSQTVPQNGQTFAQVNVVERFRYVSP